MMATYPLRVHMDLRVTLLLLTFVLSVLIIDIMVQNKVCDNCGTVLQTYGTWKGSKGEYCSKQCLDENETESSE